MLKIIEHQESYVIKHSSINMKKETFWEIPSNALMAFFKKKLLSCNRNDLQN